MVDPTGLTLVELAAAYRDGSLRPTEVLRAYLEKITPGPVYRLVLAERAGRQAERAESLFASGTDLGPLQGIPVALKDLMDTKGEVTAAGSRVLARGDPATADCPAAARLEAAGAVFLGKTNMTELAFSGIGINPHFGTPGNAWDDERIPGGSSSGSAVAVATGLACAAVGSDTGGSVRIPASFNGIVGLKTTDGLIPMGGCVPLSTTLDTLGPMARTAEDAWMLFCALAGRPYAPLERPTGPLTLLAPTTVLQEKLEPAVATAFAGVCERLERRGHRVIGGELPVLSEIPELYRSYGNFAGHEALALHGELLERFGAEVDPRVLKRILAFRGRPAVDYLRLSYARERLRREFWLGRERVDAVIAPTVSILPPRIGDLATDDAYFEANGLCLENTMIFNFLGGPAASVPTAVSAGNLPVGVMIATAPGGEEQALGIGALLA